MSPFRFISTTSTRILIFLEGILMPSKPLVYFTVINTDDVEQGYLMSRNFHKIENVLDRIGEAISTIRDFNRKIKYGKIAIVRENNPEYTETFVNLADAIKGEDIIYFPSNINKDGMLVKVFGVSQENEYQHGSLRFRYDIYKLNVLLEAALICDLVLPN